MQLCCPVPKRFHRVATASNPLSPATSAYVLHSRHHSTWTVFPKEQCADISELRLFEPLSGSLGDVRRETYLGAVSARTSAGHTAANGTWLTSSMLALSITPAS